MNLIKIGILNDALKDMVSALFTNEFILYEIKVKYRSRIRLINFLMNNIVFIYNIWKIDYLYVASIQNTTWYYCKLANLFNKRVIYHWIGTDVYDFIRFKYNPFKFNCKVDLHLAYSSNLSKELEEINIYSKVLYIPPIINKNVALMPKEHAILLSIPDDSMESAEFYGYSFLTKLIVKFPNLKFFVMRAKNRGLFNYDNVHFLGEISAKEVESVYDLVSIVLRYTIHDGTSLLVMESLIKGKYVIYNHDFPNTFKANDVNQYEIAIKSLINTDPKPNNEGREYALSEFDFGKARKKFINYLNSIIED